MRRTAATAPTEPAPSETPRESLLLREVPQPSRRGLVVRDRLVRRLLAARVRLVVVGAPAGYGKTALLREWSARDARPFHRLPTPRGSAAARRWAPAVQALATRAGRLPGGAVLVADDLPAGLDGGAAGALVAIAEGLAEGSTLAIASRSAAVVPVGRLRAEHDVLELGARDLAMTPREAAALLEGCGLRLAGAPLDALMAATEGWPAALSLAAESLAGEPDAGRAAARFGGGDPFAAAYVRDELLAGLPPDLRRFLRRSSVLDVLDPPACDALLEALGSEALLFELQRSPLPVEPVERGGLRLRCHPLVRDVLLAELRRGEPADERALQRRASAWCERAGDVDAAVRHALAAGDVDRAGALLWRLAEGVAWDAGRALVDRWLERIPAADARRHEGLRLAGAMADLSRLAIAEADHRLSAAGGAPGAVPPDLRRSLGAGRHALEAATTHHGLAPLRERAARGAALAGDGEPVAALCLLLEGAGALLAGDAVRALAALEDGGRRSAVSAPGIAALCQAELALMALLAGDHEHGATLAERARARADAIGLREHAALALVVAVGAFARAHRGRFAEARGDVQLAIELLGDRDELPAWYGGPACVALARAELRLSDVAAARRLLADAERAARRLGDAPALRDWIAEAGTGAHGPATSELADAAALTVAELRVLRFLPSHLSFREIGGCLHVSSNTIKSQAHAVYRKLGASSRSIAVERARALGLLDPGGGPPSNAGDVVALCPP